MHINKIRLVNFRGMEDLTVEFVRGINVIIGDNGAGKTSLLKGAKIIISSILNDDEHIADAEIQKEDIRFTSNAIGDATTNIQYHTPVSVEGEIDFDNAVYICKSIKKTEDSDSAMDNISRIWDNDYSSEINQKIQQRLNDKNSSLPLLSYQSDQKNLSPFTKMEQIPQAPIERRQGYEEAFSGIFSIDTVQNWCFQMEIRNFQEHRKISEYETFKQTVSQFIRIIENKEINGKIYFASDLWTLVYSDGKSRQPLYNLSSGYQTILNTIMELTYRAIILNPTMKDFKNLEGVVIIDEIDMHLHPKWQWKIIEALRKTFPEVQFIVATHSPIIISSAENARLLLMTSPNEVEPLEDAYGINVDNILELRQQSVDMPPELKEWRKKIMKFLNNNDINNAKNTIKEAETKHGADSAITKKLNEFFNMNKWIAEA